MSRLGLLVMAYGGPARLDEVEPYLLDVRGFRDTPRPLIDEVRGRYARIGGRSPILEQTRAQAHALQRALAARGLEVDAEVGMRHWHPHIRDALARLEERGVGQAIGLVMAPQYSRMSIGKYLEAVADAGAPVEVAAIPQWHLLPGYIHALADRVRTALHRFPSEARASVPVIFTAHSLPQRIRSWGDPYPEQVTATMRAVVAELGEPPHRLAYQSAAMTPDPWLGPDVGDVVTELAANGARHALAAPVGFVCEHVEILYDIDIQLRERAREVGCRLERIEMLNDHPAMIAGLADLVAERAAQAGWR